MMVVPQWWTCFWDFQSDWVPFSASSNSQARSDWPLIVLIFNPIDPLFSQFPIQLTAFFWTMSDPIWSIFQVCAEPPYQTFCRVMPPSPCRDYTIVMRPSNVTIGKSLLCIRLMLFSYSVSFSLNLLFWICIWLQYIHQLYTC